MSDAQKIPPYSIVEMTNRHPRFYELVGPLLSRREVAQDLGAPVWDDDDKTWFAAVAGDVVIGMVAVRRKEVCSFYVAPAVRGEAVGYALLRAALRVLPASRATATDASRPLFERFGFESHGRRGRYHTMRRDIAK